MYLIIFKKIIYLYKVNGYLYLKKIKWIKDIMIVTVEYSFQDIYYGEILKI